MLNRIILVVILVPLAVVLITLSIANRGMTALTLDPFNPGNPALTLSLPLFVWLFGALGLGILVGGLGAWLRQGFYRRLARRRGREAEALRRGARSAGATPGPMPVEPAPGDRFTNTPMAALPKPGR